MPAPDPKAGALIDLFHQMKSARAPFEKNWQDIKDMIRPGAGAFQRHSAPGADQANAIYDSTAPKACGQFASAIHGYLVNPTDRWLSLGVAGVPDEQLSDEALDWLEHAAEVIYSNYQVEESNFTTSMHENFLDIGAFGNGCVYQDWDYENGHLLFKHFTLAEVFIKLNYRGRVDTVAKACKYTVRQIEQEFKGPFPPGLADEMRISDKRPDKEFTIVHIVMPRKDRNPGIPNKTNKPWASYHLCEDTKELIEEGGYDSFPYTFGRWMVMSPEIYGRGPAIDMLPDIRVLNKYEFILLKCGMKLADPPLQIESDAFNLPIPTEPGSTIIREQGSQPAEPLISGENLPISMEQAEQKRMSIREGFYSDWIRMDKENVEMTAYEVQDRRGEKFRMMTPLLGRITSEQLGPTIARSYSLLVEYGRIKPPPEELQNRKLKVVYIGPAAKAQEEIRAMNNSRLVQDLAPIAQVDPTVMDVIDTDEFARDMARSRSVSRKILRSPDEVKAIREQRAQAQMMQQAAAAAEPISKAVKNVADAQRI
jgi:hypothetical protein